MIDMSKHLAATKGVSNSHIPSIMSFRVPITLRVKPFDEDGNRYIPIQLSSGEEES